MSRMSTFLLGGSVSDCIEYVLEFCNFTFAALSGEELDSRSSNPFSAARNENDLVSQRRVDGMLGGHCSDTNEIPCASALRFGRLSHKGFQIYTSSSLKGK